MRLLRGLDEIVALDVGAGGRAFPLGRPLGTPGDPPFQTAVLTEALALLEYPEGPVLADYPIDCDEHEDADASLACPVNFQNRPEVESSTDRELSGYELLQSQSCY